MHVFIWPRFGRRLTSQVLTAPLYIFQTRLHAIRSRQDHTSCVVSGYQEWWGEIRVPPPEISALFLQIINSQVDPVYAWYTFKNTCMYIKCAACNIITLYIPNLRIDCRLIPQTLSLINRDRVTQSQINLYSYNNIMHVLHPDNIIYIYSIGEHDTFNEIRNFKLF